MAKWTEAVKQHAAELRKATTEEREGLAAEALRAVLPREREGRSPWRVIVFEAAAYGLANGMGEVPFFANKTQEQVEGYFWHKLPTLKRRLADDLIIVDSRPWSGTCLGTKRSVTETRRLTGKALKTEVDNVNYLVEAANEADMQLPLFNLEEVKRLPR